MSNLFITDWIDARKALKFFGFLSTNTNNQPFPALIFALAVFLQLILIFVGAWLFPVPGWKEYQILEDEPSALSSREAILRNVVFQSRDGYRGVMGAAAIYESGFLLLPLESFEWAHGRLFVPWKDLCCLGRRRLGLWQRDYFAVERDGKLYLQISFPLWREEAVELQIRSRLTPQGNS